MCVFFFHLHFCKSCSHRAETRQTCALTRPTEFYSLKLRGAELTLTSDGHTYERADKVSLQRLLRAKKKKVMIFTQSFSKEHTGVFCFPGDGKYTNCCQEGQVLPYNALPKMFGMTN